MSKSKATATVHAVLTACFAYGAGIETLRATFKGKSPDAVRAALRPGVTTKELDAVASDLHTRVKQAWDPQNILNPGKSLPRW